ncbi:GAF domain-containing protein [Streptomyces sp. DASNCL29]|uniref:GAF domain-containing protein n=1 Tax=Streptomyces sp. DASNCL29 TaxID=2583819 RepID=UPI001F0DED2F|nr:GAF domain-containing protein [Streptomyces sp. DASNCL29]
MDSHRLAPRLLASWQRSRHYGLSPEEMRPVFTGSVDTASLFYECGDEVLRGLRDTLADEAVSMMIADSDGLVLHRVCDDASISRSLDRVHLAPGFSFAERDVGTNGLGLALADRAPSLVRADEHYCAGLRGYTCAAAPVLDPRTGALAGTVNLTTWSASSSELLLALAQAAAGNTAALMLARGRGRRVPPAPRGEVFRVYADRYHQHDHAHQRLSPGWTDAVATARTASARGRVVAAVGEPGAGKTALVSTARRQTGARERLLSARPPAPGDVAAWLALWAPELGKDNTCVVVSGVDRLPAWAATDLARLFDGARRATGEGPGCLPPFAVTAQRYSAIPDVLSPLIDTVVEVPALRFRPDDILPLARHFARRHRGPTVTFTPAAARALTSYDWPENVRQLRRVVREAGSRTDVIDTRHLPAEVFTRSGSHLTRLQLLERDEIVRCLTEPGTTVARAAAALGMGRATIYRKMARYGIQVPGGRGGTGG